MEWLLLLSLVIALVLGVPVAFALLPLASVATALTAASYSPDGMADASKLADQLPAAATVADCVTAPKVTSTVAPGCAVPVRTTPSPASYVGRFSKDRRNLRFVWRFSSRRTARSGGQGSV